MSDESPSEPAADAAEDDEPAADESTGTDEPEAAEPATDEETVDENDFVRVDYTARSVENEQLVDTTDPAIAEEEGVDPEQQSIEPRVVPIGAGHLFPSVEEAFIGHAIGDTGTVVVPAGEAFGEYDPDDVRTVSTDVIPEDDRYPGAQVELEGETGHVERIIGGRARVDFNHPLAGEDIKYEFEILELINEPEEQAKAMLYPVVDAEVDLWIQTDEVEEEVPVEEPDEAAAEADDDAAEGDDEPEPVEMETELVEKRTLYIESVPQMAMNQQWLFSKRQVAQDLIDRLDLDRVIIQETIEGTGGPFGAMGGPGADLEDVASEIEDVDLEDVEEDLDLDADEE